MLCDEEDHFHPQVVRKALVLFWRKPVAGGGCGTRFMIEANTTKPANANAVRMRASMMPTLSGLVDDVVNQHS